MLHDSATWVTGVVKIMMTGPTSLNMPIIPTSRRLRQEDLEFKARADYIESLRHSLGYIARSYSNRFLKKRQCEKQKQMPRDWWWGRAEGAGVTTAKTVSFRE